MTDTGDSPSAYDDVPDGIVVADGQGVVRDVNQAATRITGRSRQELLGRPLRDALPLLDPQGKDWWQCTRPFDGLNTRTRQPERLLSLCVDGEPARELLVTARFGRNEDRSISRFVVSLRDTTARARAERSGAELVSVVAHELRSPLTSVKGFTATLLAKWDRFGDEQKRVMLQTINADADRVTRLISELLDVSRIETGRLELRKQVVDLAAIIRADVAARVAAGEPEGRFVLDLVPTEDELWADPDKLAQVVGNIIENALRHGAGTVTVQLDDNDGGVRLAVTDEGDGIAAEARPRVFTKFWRGNRRSGTGLGLFIAKGIVDAHGGMIAAGSSPQGGARIVVELPAGTPAFAQ